MSRAIHLNPQVWYYLLRVKLAEKRLKRSTLPEFSEKKDALIDTLYYWKDRSKRDNYPNDTRHRCRHTRHSLTRNSHRFRVGPFGYNHYPLRAENKDPAYFILPWGSDSHHAVDIAFKWNLYCFAIDLKRPFRRQEAIASAVVELQNESTQDSN